MKTIIVGQLGKIITGNTPPRNQPELYGNATIFIKPTDISEDSKYTYSPEECYSEKGANKYRSSLIPKGSTCVVTIGSIGRKMTMSHTECFINQAMNAIIPNEDYDNEYVYYLLKNNLPKLKSLDSGTSSGRENVSKSAFSNMELEVVETKDVQRRIGKILSSYDNLIDNNQKQIKLLEEAAIKLYKEWFVNLRFPSYENTPVVNGIPEGWQRGKLSEIIDIRYGKDHKKIPNGQIPVYGSGGLMRKCNKKLYEGESILIPRKGSLNNIMHVHEAFWTVDTMFYTHIKKENFAKYLYFVLSAFDMYGMNIGAAVPSMTTSILDSIDIVIPAPEVMKLFEHSIDPMFRRKKVLLNQCDAATQARDKLLPKLMSGEIEV